MSDEYLWNREGEPDEQVVRLERLLAPLRYSAPKPLPRRAPRAWWLAAAALLLGSVAAYQAWNRATRTSWQTADGRSVRAGRWIGAASIESPFTGRVDIEPRARLRVIASGENEQRLHLEEGTIHALIWAPPGRFVVDTPSAKTIDLGCRYTLRIERDGTGLVTVETGWVAFESGRLESFIPAGAACVTRPGLGPGTPWFTDAPQVLRNAVAAFDTSRGTGALNTAALDTGALDTALRAARRRDALTLWHLLVRTRAAQRAAVFDRLASLVDLPPAAGRDAVLRGDPAALDASWNALDLGSAGWWREWKRKW